MTTNGVCVDRWYVMIFLYLMRTVSMHFIGQLDCSKGRFNRLSLMTVFRSRVVLRLNLKGKYRIDVNRGGQLLTLICCFRSVNKSSFGQPPRRVLFKFFHMYVLLFIIVLSGLHVCQHLYSYNINTIIFVARIYRN